MADATPEPRVSDERLAQHIEAYQGRAGTAWVAFIALDLRDARATIASQAESLAAKEAEIAALTHDIDAALKSVTLENEARTTAEAALKEAREEAAKIADPSVKS